MTAPQEQRGGRLKSLEAYVAYLVLRHSQDQEAIAAGLALSLYPIWMIQRFTELDRSTPLWLSAALPVVKTAYLQSQRVAAVFAENVRFASLPTEDPLPMILPNVELPAHVPVGRFNLPDLTPSTGPSVSVQEVVTFDEFPVGDVSTSLAIQGNYNVKAAMPGQEQMLMYNGLKNSSGAAIRQAMNGGRNAIDNVVQKDRRVIGYARFTDSNPCYFCALLASRGAMYGKGSFVEKDATFKVNPNGASNVPADYLHIAKVHDHCRCTLRPVYSTAQSMDADAKFYKQQWDAVWEKHKHLSNKKQIEKWKEQYHPFNRPEPNITELHKELEQRHSALLSAGFSPISPQVTWAASQQYLLAS